VICWEQPLDFCHNFKSLMFKASKWNALHAPRQNSKTNFSSFVAPRAEWDDCDVIRIPHHTTRERERVYTNLAVVTRLANRMWCVCFLSLGTRPACLIFSIIIAHSRSWNAHVSAHTRVLCQSVQTWNMALIMLHFMHPPEYGYCRAFREWNWTRQRINFNNQVSIVMHAAVHFAVERVEQD
jgi:hypothetical protein